MATIRPAEAGRYVASRPAVSGSTRTDPDIVVLGADTVVVVDGDILGKPQDDADAATMLRRLSGRRHEVLTGVSVRTQTDEAGMVETTAVAFSPLSDADIAWYVASGEGRDKAGGYAIQGLAARFIPRIDGSYSNVVGLPLAAVSSLLTTIASAFQSGYSER
jgi:septum formation protein